ncbi:serine/threonine-protein kinase [Rhodococcus chondri]|uniref:Serine/threonine-protein kinase n=1 Tax=Rhodococcus chondri TaxID=3065941 RepID=A0ABU7JPH7_9NOCA|nr:serine/threonine-protein kinase [Rhodococcus sp. CC-R104]MEE2031379.1 serine/threonine-protein kinase [Rhodococcus sp. CC-R104]
MATQEPDPTVAADPTKTSDTAATDMAPTAATFENPPLTRTAPAVTDPFPSDEPATVDDVHAGERIDDFHLLTTLGAGAFGRVFLARQVSMQRLVAVKISRNRGSEAQTLAQLDHDYIVRVFDQRILPEHGLRLLYMQYMPGGTLLRVLNKVRGTPAEQRSGRLLIDAVDDALREKGEIRPTDSTVRLEIGALSWPETVAWLGRRLAEALDYADGRGVLHRDIKPANVLLTAEGVPKLADFNISFAETVDNSSPVAYLGGSLAYMSPEQLEACHPNLPGNAAELDTRSDIYALGVMLWELLTGSRPDDAEGGALDPDAPTVTALDSMLQRRGTAPGEAALAQLPADCPPSLCRVLVRCLSPRPADRWASGTDLAQQFDLCLDARARALVDPPARSWRARLRRPVVPVLAAAIGIPNILGALYNYQHNATLIVDRLPPDSQALFEMIALIINATVFPLGTAVIVYFGRRVITVPRGLHRGRTYSAVELARARHDALLLADRVIVVVMALWVISGIAFPVIIQQITGDLDGRAITHFVASIVVCGAIAVAYPFFFVAFYMVRSLYPAFLPHGATDATDARELEGLHRRSVRYLALAAAVPLAAVAGSTFLTIEEIPQVQVAVRVLSVGSIVAFVLVYWLFRLMEQDLEALQRSVAVRQVTEGWD